MRQIFTQSCRFFLTSHTMWEKNDIMPLLLKYLEKPHSDKS